MFDSDSHATCLFSGRKFLIIHLHSWSTRVKANVRFLRFCTIQLSLLLKVGLMVWLLRLGVSYDRAWNIVHSHHNARAASFEAWWAERSITNIRHALLDPNLEN